MALGRQGFNPRPVYKPGDIDAGIMSRETAVFQSTPGL